METLEIAFAGAQLLVTLGGALGAAFVGAKAGLSKVRTELTLLKAETERLKLELQDQHEQPASTLHTKVAADHPYTDAIAASLTETPKHPLVIHLHNTGERALTALKPSIGQHTPIARIEGNDPVNEGHLAPGERLDLDAGQQATLVFDFVDSYTQRNKFLIAFSDHRGKRWTKTLRGHLQPETPTAQPSNPSLNTQSHHNPDQEQQ